MALSRAVGLQFYQPERTTSMPTNLKTPHLPACAAAVFAGAASSTDSAFAHSAPKPFASAAAWQPYKNAALGFAVERLAG